MTEHDFSGRQGDKCIIKRVRTKLSRTVTSFFSQTIFRCCNIVLILNMITNDFIWKSIRCLFNEWKIFVDGSCCCPNTAYTRNRSIDASSIFLPITIIRFILSLTSGLKIWAYIYIYIYIYIFFFVTHSMIMTRNTFNFNSKNSKSNLSFSSRAVFFNYNNRNDKRVAFLYLRIFQTSDSFFAVMWKQLLMTLQKTNVA